MKISEVVTEATKKTLPRGGVHFGITDSKTMLFITAETKSGRELGMVEFVKHGNELVAHMLEVDERYQGQGIAREMYDVARSLGYTIQRSSEQTDAGRGFWDKNRGVDGQVWESEN